MIHQRSPSKKMVHQAQDKLVRFPFLCSGCCDPSLSQAVARLVLVWLAGENTKVREEREERQRENECSFSFLLMAVLKDGLSSDGCLNTASRLQRAMLLSCSAEPSYAPQSLVTSTAPRSLVTQTAIAMAYVNWPTRRPMLSIWPTQMAYIAYIQYVHVLT